jgi:sugar/nucleoside kinase (ribokinase family)
MSASVPSPGGLLLSLDGIEHKLHGRSVLCLPDLFLDHIVALPKWGEIQRPITAAFLRGGGAFRGGAQRLTSGGNAFNTARALARLGVPARFVGVTSREAFEFAQRETSGEPLDLSLVQQTGTTSMTVAMEFGPERVNVMVNDPGSLDGLRVEDLGPGLGNALHGAAAVHVANWAQNRTAGTPFVTEILRMAKREGALTFLDPADLTNREPDVLEFIHKVPQGEHLDWMLVNESELRELARVLLLHESTTSPCAHDDTEGQGKEFTKRVRSGLAAHTLKTSQSFRGGKAEGAAPVTLLAPARQTGAGDVWNAGFIAGVLGGLAPKERLELGNTVARLFVGGAAGAPPTLAEVRKALSAPHAPAR